MPGGLQVFDLQKQRSVYMNRTVASVLGYSPAEIDELGDGVAQTLMHPDDLARFPAHIECVRSLGDDRVPISFSCVTRRVLSLQCRQLM